MSLRSRTRLCSNLALASWFAACGGATEGEVDLQGADTIRQAFTPAPSILKVRPPYCALSGGCDVEIDGKDFTGSTKVTVGGVDEPCVVLSPKLLRFRASPRTVAGLHRLVVSNIGGSDSYAPGFYYYADPADFLPPYTVRTSAAPRRVVSGDWNGDGTPDLAVLYAGKALVEIFLGRGNQRFVPAGKIPISAEPYSLAAVNLNGDKYSDLVVTLPGKDSLAVLLGGSGTPALSVLTERLLSDGVSICKGPLDVTVGEVTGDTRDDVVIACTLYPYRGTPAFEVLESRGTGTLDFWEIDQTPELPTDLQLGDLSSDKYADLIYRGASTSTVYKALNVPGARFSASGSMGFSSRSIAVRDLNSDKRPDLVVLNSAGDSVSVHLNAAVAGPFHPPVLVPLSDSYQQLAVLDMDAGSGPDLVAMVPVRGGSKTAEILLNDSAGGFSRARRQEVALGFPVSTAVAAELNGDSRGDLLLAGSGLPYVDTPENTLHIRYGKPEGITQQQLVQVGVNATEMASADFDGDGMQDLVVLAPTGPFRSTSVQIFRRVDEEQLVPHVTLVSSTFFDSIATADLDGNGLVDLVLGSSDPMRPTLQIWYATAPKTFARIETYSLPGRPSAVTIGNLNPKNDRLPDIAVTLYDKNAVVVLTQKGTGGFDVSAPYPIGVGKGPIAISAGCVLGCPSRPELVVLNESWVVVLGEGPMGGYEMKEPTAVGPEPRAMLLEDVDGDRRLDVIVASSGVTSGDVTVVLQPATGGFMKGKVQTSTVCSMPTGLYATHLDSDIAIDLVVSCDSGVAPSIQVYYQVPGSLFAPSARTVPKLLDPLTYSSGRLLGDTLGSLPFLVAGSESTGGKGTISLLVNHPL